MFNGSTEYVIHEAMPLLVKLDGVLIPSMLQFDVPAIPTAIYTKAFKYVDAVDKRIRIFEGEGDGEYIYQFLSMSQTKYTKRPSLPLHFWASTRALWMAIDPVVLQSFSL